MKQRVILTGSFILILFITGSSCNRENNDRDEKFTGTWINLNNSKDQLIIEDSVIQRIDTLTGEFDHSYLYTITDDSIKIKYNGTYYIECSESSFKIDLDKSEMTLTIYGLDTYFPYYNGDSFIKSLK